MVVPRTYSHIESIFVRKPYISEVISIISSKQKVNIYLSKNKLSEKHEGRDKVINE